MDPAPKTKAYDNYDDAVSDAVDYVYTQTEANSWQAEYCVSVYQYANGKFYIGMRGDGKGEYSTSNVYFPDRNSKLLAIIHSHPNYQDQPFKEDWVDFVHAYRKSLELYVVDKKDGKCYTRYLPVGTQYQDQWRVYP